ncbi:MAG: extracellular solute-binding protein [Gammaproteobacteria bacterium]|nr:extracellular solute-binding protein [Gammaproteobacteria bacterium]
MRNLFLAMLVLFSVFLGSYVHSEELVVYSGRSDKFVKPVTKAFTEKTGIKVVLYSAKSTALVNKLRVEKERTLADLFLSNDAGNLQVGSDFGLFQPVSKQVAEVIPENLRASDNSWVGLSARARVLVVNTNVKGLEFVDSVFDLADPRLKNRLAITNSTNGSFIAGTTVYMDELGKEKVASWLKGIKANAGDGVFNKHSKVVKAVASGKRDVGLVNHYYIYRHLVKHPDAPIRIVIPDQGESDIGVAWNVAGVAISKFTDQKAMAEKFVEFLVSEEGQKLFAEVNMEYPARIGVPAAAAIPALSQQKIADVPMSELGKQRNATIDLIEEVGMY